MWAIFLKFLAQREIKDDMQLGGRIIVGGKKTESFIKRKRLLLLELADSRNYYLNDLHDTSHSRLLKKLFSFL